MYAFNLGYFNLDQGGQRYRHLVDFSFDVMSGTLYYHTLIKLNNVDFYEKNKIKINYLIVNSFLFLLKICPFPQQLSLTVTFWPFSCQHMATVYNISSGKMGVLGSKSKFIFRKVPRYISEPFQLYESTIEFKSLVQIQALPAIQIFGIQFGIKLPRQIPRIKQSLIAFLARF